MKRRVVLKVWGCAVMLAVATVSGAQTPQAEPLEGVPFDAYVRLWPSLQECVTALTRNDRRSATYCVDGLIHNGTAAAGAYNLKAQLLREDGKLEAADKAIDQAIRLEENQDLHYFQRAQIALTWATAAGNPLSRWSWSNTAYAAFERAFAINPKGYAYRQYLAVYKLRAPVFGGGDKVGALAMAEEGISQGCQECYLLRGYARLVLEQVDQGFADFDKAVTLGVFDNTLLLRAGQVAVERQDWARAERYYRYVVGKRPTSARAQVSLGNFFVKKGDAAQASTAYQAALALDPDYRVASDKLAALAQGR
jgi:tetratricopeptide (TPR) repeat protein